MNRVLYLTCLVLIMSSSVCSALSIEGYISPTPEEFGGVIEVTAASELLLTIAINTDENGYYRIDGLPEGMVTLTIEKFVHPSATLSTSFYLDTALLEKSFNLNEFPYKSDNSRSLKGRIIDIKGDPLPGVYVTLFHEQLGSISMWTGHDGSFDIKKVPFGRYMMRTEMMGMRTEEINDLLITNQPSVLLEVTMELAELSYDSSYGFPSVYVDVRSTTVKTRIHKEFLDRLP